EKPCGPLTETDSRGNPMIHYGATTRKCDRFQRMARSRPSSLIASRWEDPWKDESREGTYSKCRGSFERPAKSALGCLNNQSNRWRRGFVEAKAGKCPRRERRRTRPMRFSMHPASLSLPFLAFPNSVAGSFPKCFPDKALTIGHCADRSSFLRRAGGD